MIRFSRDRLPANRARKALKPSLDSRDVLLDLDDGRPAVKARPGFQVDRQAPAVHPQILKRLAVLKPSIAVHNQFNRTRHDLPAKLALAMGQD